MFGWNSSDSRKVNSCEQAIVLLQKRIWFTTRCLLRDCLDLWRRIPRNQPDIRSGLAAAIATSPVDDLEGLLVVQQLIQDTVTAKVPIENCDEKQGEDFCSVASRLERQDHPSRRPQGLRLSGRLDVEPFYLIVRVPNVIFRSSRA